MRSRRFLARAALVASLTVSTIIPGASPAGANPDKGAPLSDEVHAVGATPEVLALMRDQIPLDEAADRIEQSAKNGSRAAGLGGFIVDADNHRLNVYWKGAVTPSLRAEQKAGTAKGIDIAVHKSAFTVAELEAERDRLAKAHLKEKADGAHIVSIGPKPDGSGLEVGVAGLPTAKATRQAAQQALAGITSSVTLDAVPAEAALPTARFGDVEPFYGGAFMVREGTNNACSTGFGLKTSYEPQPKVMLTAAHCGQGSWFNGTGWDLFENFMGGTFPDEDRSHDAMIVAMPSDGRIYDGGSIAGEANQFSKPVRGQFGNRTGDSICTSGAFSGANCGIRVAATGQTITMRNFGTVRNMIRAEKNDRTGAVGNGDSGGPAFSLTSDATGVYARGTISAISSDQADFRACRGVPAGPNDDPNARHCSWKFWYPDILVQLEGLNAASSSGKTFRVLTYGE